MLEAQVQEQTEELSASREKTNIAITKMMALETELKSKASKLEDLETREQKYVKAGCRALGIKHYFRQFFIKF